MNVLVNAIARLAALLPRGGFRIVSFAARRSPALQAYPAKLKLLPDTWMRLDLRESVSFPLLKYGCYPHQIAEDRLALGFLRSGDCVWDIGANIGYTALLYARAVGPSGCVVAVEPSRRAFPLLVRSVAEVAHIVHPFQAAISDFSGEIDFADAEMLDTSGVVENKLGGYRVPCDTLDSLLERPPRRAPDFIKIDVEGHELQALRGATRVIGEHRPIVEFEALTDKARADTVAQLGALGAGAYAYYRIRCDGHLVPHDSLWTVGMTNNYLAIAPTRDGPIISLKT
jgi:FkbM family methyltransferase